MSKIERRIKKIVAQTCGEGFSIGARKLTPDEFDESYDLFKDLPIDEISIIKITERIEDQFELDFPFDVQLPTKIGDLIIFVKSHI